MKQYQKKDRAAYQVAYEVLSKRNSTILGLIGFGVVWVGLFFAVFNVQWFAFESIDAFIDLNSQTDDEQSNYNGGIWWSLLAVFLFSLAFAPIAFGVTMMTYRNEDVTDKWKKELFGLLSSIPTAIIWALLWLICLPYTWTLLPWGPWETNWWKIFPYLFGIIWFGGLPLLFVVINFFRKLINREYNYDLNNSEKDSEQTVSLSTKSERAELDDVISTEVLKKSPEKPVDNGKRVMIITIGVAMLIPGIVLLILGGAMSASFVQERVSSATLEVADEDGQGDLGFIIFVEAIPGDNNWNGIHDYCERITIDATHTGGWFTNPWSPDARSNSADETRQVFQIEIASKDDPNSQGCSTQVAPEEKHHNGTRLVKLGRACYGCMTGTTSIIAYYDDNPTKSARIWIQDAEETQAAGVLIIIGGVLTGIPIIFGVLILILKATKETSNPKGILPVNPDRNEIPVNTEPIEIIENSVAHQTVRFKLNDPPKGRDAWVGIYPANAGDQDHGDRWKWLRDIDVNNATLPGQTAGNWSIRVFKDAGYILVHRFDFEIHSPPQQLSTPTSSKDLAEGQVALKSVHGKYLSAQPDGRAEWNRDRADVWEYFNLEKRQGGKIALKGAHGKYVSAQPDGSVQINRAAAPQGGWEEFTIEHGSIQPVGREGYDVVRLKSIHGKYLSAQSDGRAEWNRVHAPDGGWEDIEMEYHKKDTHATESIKKIQSALKRSSEAKKTNFWDTVN